MTLSGYHIIYYSLILIVFLIIRTHNFNLNKKSNKILSCGLIILLSLIIGSRPTNIGTDTIAYNQWFDGISNMEYNSWGEILKFGKDPFFSILLLCAAKIGNFSTALFLICFLTNVLFYNFCYCICKRQFQQFSLLLYLFIICSFCCFNMQINVIRSGLGISLMLNSFYYITVSKYKKSLLFALLGLFTHFSVLLGLLCFIGARFFNISNRLFLLLYCISLFIAFLGYGIIDFNILGKFDLKAVAFYTENSFDYKIGFRGSFALFNTVFLLLFIKLKDRIHSSIYLYLLNYFILASSIFFLWFVLPFSDRIGAFSWIIIPVLLLMGSITYFKRPKRLLSPIFITYYIINFSLSYIHT